MDHTQFSMSKVNNFLPVLTLLFHFSQSNRTFSLFPFSHFFPFTISFFFFLISSNFFPFPLLGVSRYWLPLYFYYFPSSRHNVVLLMWRRLGFFGAYTLRSNCGKFFSNHHTIISHVSVAYFYRNIVWL